MMFQPDFQSSGFPIVHSNVKPLYLRRRRVRVATQLTIEAHIPTNYWEPIIILQPPRLSMALKELHDRVETLSTHVSNEGIVIQNELSVLLQYKREYEDLKKTRASHCTNQKTSDI